MVRVYSIRIIFSIIPMAIPTQANGNMMSKKERVKLFTQMAILMMATGARIRLMVEEHTVISTVIPMMVSG